LTDTVRTPTGAESGAGVGVLVGLLVGVLVGVIVGALVGLVGTRGGDAVRDLADGRVDGVALDAA
jgi:uncharacterized membrane protein